MKRIRILILAAIAANSCFGQDGSDIKYMEGRFVSDLLKNRLVHVDFYNRSFRAKNVDTVTLKVQDKPVLFLEYRKDNGFNNWFSEQYLESVEKVNGEKIRLTKSRIDSVVNNYVFLTHYFEFYSDDRQRTETKAIQEAGKVRKTDIAELLIQE